MIEKGRKMSFFSSTKTKQIQMIGECAPGCKILTHEDLLEEVLGKRWVMPGEVVGHEQQRKQPDARGIISAISISDSPGQPVTFGDSDLHAYLVLDYIIGHEGSFPLGDGSEYDTGRFIKVQPFADLKKTVLDANKKRQELWNLLQQDWDGNANDIQWRFNLVQNKWVDLPGWD